MTFEEFFKKKRIELGAFERGGPELYFEFKTHYQQMGEKSFDHTKKYWFNKLRREYPLPVEVKTEKPKIENPLAEQTITESLTETSSPPQPALKTGFVPRFKTSLVGKPPDTGEEKASPKTQQQPEAANLAEPAPLKPGYQPRFKMKAKSEEPEERVEDEKPEQDNSAPAKPAYKPRFNVKNLPPKDNG